MPHPIGAAPKMDLLDFNARHRPCGRFRNWLPAGLAGDQPASDQFSPPVHCLHSNKVNELWVFTE